MVAGCLLIGIAVGAATSSLISEIMMHKQYLHFDDLFYCYYLLHLGGVLDTNICFRDACYTAYTVNCFFILELRITSSVGYSVSVNCEVQYT